MKVLAIKVSPNPRKINEACMTKNWGYRLILVLWILDFGKIVTTSHLFNGNL